MFKIQGLKFKGIYYQVKPRKFIIDFLSHITLFSAVLDVHLANFSISSYIAKYSNSHQVDQSN